MSQTPVDYRALMGKALLEIKDLKARVQRHEQEKSEAIAIIGMACRFPGGANSADQYWNLLRDGVDAIGEVPAARWDIDRLHDADDGAAGKMRSRFGGFIDDIGGFDASFFGISPREAEALDPHQRILLEVCWEALEHANLVPESLYGSNAGVFIGVSSMDQVISRMGEDALAAIGPYHGTGCAMAPIAGRVSYNFGFNGPSFVVDTACSSSLLSLHLAAESLRRRECDLALAGGVHLLFHPGYSVAFSKAGMLAVDGRCKTFDASADGYVRGEGCGVVVLKRLSDAQRDGDPILALLRGSAVNQDGASGGLTVPSGPSQEQVVRQALARAGLEPARVSYVEAHGTGTPLGDPIELGALGNVFKQPLLVGSVKSNIGHLEASAGIASVIKVVLALQHETIPPHLHLKQPNPLIPWRELAISVPTSLTPWPDNGLGERVAGISAFGFSGTNVHMVLSAPPAVVPSVTDGAALPAPTAHLLALSARGEPALRALAARWAETTLAPAADLADGAFAALCAGAGAHRTPFAQRLSLVAGDAAQARTMLQEFASHGSAAGVSSADARQGQPSVAFLFTGQGAQYPGMGAALYREAPVFRAAFDACDALLLPELGFSLAELLYRHSDADQESIKARLDATGTTQPALFALEYALAQLWLAYGVQPAAVMGHSVGEYVAACVAGVFSLADGLRLIAARGRLMQALPAGGAMAAVLAEPSLVEAALAAHDGALSVAAYNGPRNTVVSGSAVALDALLAGLATQGIESRRLPVSHAFHSNLMAPMLDAFRRVAETVTYRAPQLAVMSNVSGQAAGAELATADYWVRHVSAPVRFGAGVRALAQQGHAMLIEVGPSATLVALALQNLDDGAADVGRAAPLLLPSLRKGQPDLTILLDTLGQYWAHGGAVKWQAVHGATARRALRLPSYPFTHRQYWHGSGVDARDGLHGVSGLDQPLLARRFNSPLLRETLFETVFSKAALPFIDDHRVFGQLVVAGASHLSLVLSAAALAAPSDTGSVLRDVMFPQALVVPEDGERVVQLALGQPAPGQPGAGAAADAALPFRLISLSPGSSGPDGEYALHAQGRVAPAAAPAPAPDLNAIWLRCPEELPLEEVYALQRRRHIVVGPSYQWLTALRRGYGETVAKLCAPPALRSSVHRYSLHPGLIDSCFGALVMAQRMEVEESFIPFSIEALHFYGQSDAMAGQPLLAHAVVRQHDALRLVGDIAIYDAQGRTVASFIGLEGRRASRAALLAASIPAQDDGDITPALYRVGWSALALPPAATVPARWLVLADAGGIGAHLAATLRATGATVTLALADGNADGLQLDTPGQYRLRPTAPTDLTALLAACDGIDAVLYLWGAAALADDGGAAFIDYQQNACGGALHLLQALAARGDRSPLRLWLATSGAQAVFDGAAVPAPQQALLWGMGLAAAEEQLDLDCVCIDLDPDANSADNAGALLASVALDASERRLAWRAGALYGARLQPMDEPAAPVVPDAGGTCLITGASGALGRELALWLARRGVVHLALLGRTEADQQQLAQLAREGAQARHYRVDPGERDALAAVLRRIEAEQAPLSGVYHLAGALDDGLLATQAWQRWLPVLAAKAGAAWNLHQLTRSMAVPHFVGFSSASALLGNAGQASYGAANAFVDALAQHRRGAGLPALSIDWGPWGEAGMAVRLDAGQRARLAAGGVAGIASGAALDLLGKLLDGGAGPQVGVLAMAWPRYAQAHPASAAFLSELTVAPELPQQGAGAVREQLRQAEATARLPLLNAILVALVAEVLGLAPNEVAPRQRLFDLGVDSLLAMDLRRRLQAKLGLALAPTLLFDYPTIEALAAHLLEQLAPAEAEARAVARTHDDAPIIGAVADLSEEEAESLLLAQLEQLERLMP